MQIICKIYTIYLTTSNSCHCSILYNYSVYIICIRSETKGERNINKLKICLPVSNSNLFVFVLYIGTFTSDSGDIMRL